MLLPGLEQRRRHRQLEIAARTSSSAPTDRASAKASSAMAIPIAVMPATKTIAHSVYLWPSYSVAIIFFLSCEVVASRLFLFLLSNARLGFLIVERRPYVLKVESLGPSWRSLICSSTRALNCLVSHACCKTFKSFQVWQWTRSPTTTAESISDERLMGGLTSELRENVSEYTRRL